MLLVYPTKPCSRVTQHSYSSDFISLYRCNFALIILSELVITLQDVDWSPHLPLLLHVVLLGLDLIRTLIFEHSKRLLGNLVVVLACKDDKVAALQARYV